MFKHLKFSLAGMTGLAFLAAFLFTFTANVFISPEVAWAEDLSQRDTNSETAEESKEAKEKLSGAADGAVGFFGGIIGWIKGVTDSINNMWGMENGSGMASVVNFFFYLILIGIFLFAGKMIFNIFKDMFKGKGNVPERYQKPSFRKK